MEQGEFDYLPGVGKPMFIEDDSLVPEELRMAYRIMKNAGCLPPELELRKEIVNLADMLGLLSDEQERNHARRKLSLLISRLDAMRPTGSSLELEDIYYQKLLNRFTG
jgi:hypothetical protein